MGCVPLWSESGITNANGMSLLMKPWIHYAPYMDTIKGLEETVDYLLSNPNKIKEIKNNAKTHVLEHHTYKNRVMGVLKRMNILYYKEDK
jgi:spore maturation protein CgeB